MNVLPHNVLLKPLTSDKVINGVIIPDFTKVPHKDATVVSAGEETEVSIGDRVKFDERSATKVVVDEEYFLLRGDKILYVYDDN